MSYYDRNRNYSLEGYLLIKPDSGSLKKPSTRSQKIDDAIEKRRKAGEYLPEPGTSVEYRAGSGSGVGRVMGYDLNDKGELLILTVPPDEETRRTGKMLIVIRTDEISRTSKMSSQIIRR